MLKDYLLRNNLITFLWYWNPWQEANERNTKLILISLRAFLLQKGIQCRDYLVLLLICYHVYDYVFKYSNLRREKRETLGCIHWHEIASPALKRGQTGTEEILRYAVKRTWRSLGAWKRDRSDTVRGSQEKLESPGWKRELLGPYPPLTLRISPRLKLSSSSAVALKSYLAMASMLELPRNGGAGAGKEALPEASAPPAARLRPRRRPRFSHTGSPGDDPP